MAHGDRHNGDENCAIRTQFRNLVYRLVLAFSRTYSQPISKDRWRLRRVARCIPDSPICNNCVVLDALTCPDFLYQIVIWKVRFLFL